MKKKKKISRARGEMSYKCFCFVSPLLILLPKKGKNITTMADESNSVGAPPAGFLYVLLSVAR